MEQIHLTPTYYSEVSQGAHHIHQQILTAAREHPEIRSLYKGCQLLFSPLLERPKILLIGFNPGGGYFKHHGSIAENFEPMPAMEYYLNKHRLGEQTKDLFRQAGMEEDLKHSTVKTNFYYWATDNVADFKRLLQLLPEDLSSRIFHFARVWTKQLIEGLQPEVIIAEGFQAYNEIKVLFPKRSESDDGDIKYFFNTGQKFLGYKRNQGSIVNKEVISSFLKDSLKSNLIINNK